MRIDRVNLIEQRVIEASALVPVIKAFGEKIGLDSAKAVVQQTHEKMSRSYGETCAKERGSNTMADLAEIVSSWAEGGALEEEIIELTETSYVFNVTRCMYAERYRELGMEEFGTCLSCCRDKPFAEGFNADIRFERHQTLMEGAPYCDFRFTLEQDS
ncbi:L-2-amino-thiazoline-4-carboxylic acid hydrolase [Desulfospira joergensenii]|uniref:L-2-amino-thiazoline-4-carboxylic acid hydrolase n=1 Tax=Desulfospira joergensenii TaxID=53329 RepID=UPI0003B619F1|nr:L-2-amino-thiazoline-4-carboxylic acid hydrolase [Desulfospira joergensenii]